MKKILKNIQKKMVLAMVAYLAVVGVICYFVHNWAFAYSAAQRATVGIYGGLGSEIFFVPMVLVAAYFLWAKVIDPIFEARIAEVYEARDDLKHPSVKEVMILNRRNEVIRVYKRRNNRLVMINRPRCNDFVERSTRR